MGALPEDESPLSSMECEVSLTTLSQDQMVSEVIEVMLSLAGEWEYSGPVTPTTRFFADMELQSLDFVILSTALTRKFGKIPFDELYTDLSDQPEDKEITVAEYADFVYHHLPGTQAAASA
jgi:acyl carrier protein